VLVVAGPGPVADLVGSAAAAQDLSVQTTSDLAEAAAAWTQANVVFIAEELAEQVAGRALARRGGVFLVGSDDSALARWSAPLGAEVIPLPSGGAWLGAVLDSGDARSGAPILAVFGGSGGAGASTLAAALALAASQQGQSSALVDLDPLGGGIDLLLGIERAQGWRWPSLRTAEGHVGDLRGYLPQLDKVTVVSMSRESDVDVTTEPLRAIIATLRRSHDLVVIDVGRNLSTASSEAARISTRRLLLAVSSVRGIAAAAQVRQRFGLDEAELVVRGHQAGTVADVLGLPLAGRIPHNKALPAAADRGDLAWLSARNPYLRACAKLLAQRPRP
jgi:secretion/DNA translocation related CpaE-like protein